MSATSLGKSLAALMVEGSAPVVAAESYYTRAMASSSTPDYRSFWYGEKRLPSEIEPTTAAVVPAILVRKAGKFTPFWEKDGSFIEVMEEFYRRVREKNRGVY